MNKYLSVFLCLLILSIGSTHASGNFFENADLFFAKYVMKTKVDYARLKSDREELNALVKSIETYDLKNASAMNEQAFLINAYNLLVIKSIVEKYPINSPMSADGFFDDEKFMIAGQSLTLNQIENDLLRKKFKDARVHFVLVCAAVSCPPIMPFAYKPEQLDKQMTEQTVLAMNDRVFIRVDDATKKVNVSEIFKWYEEDFVKRGQSVTDFINKYRTVKLPAGYKIDYYSYNWSLNEKKK